MSTGFYKSWYYLPKRFFLYGEHISSYTPLIITPLTIAPLVLSQQLQKQYEKKNKYKKWIHMNLRGFWVWWHYDP